MPYSKANEIVAAAAAAATVGTRGLIFALSVVLYDVTCAFLVVLYTVPTRTAPLADEAAVAVPTRTGPLAYEADASIAVPTRTYPLANEAPAAAVVAVAVAVAVPTRTYPPVDEADDEADVTCQFELLIFQLLQILQWNQSIEFGILNWMY